MLQLRSKEKKIIAGLTNYRGLNIEHVLESGDKTLSFSFSKKNKFYEDIEEECYICTKDHEFVVKEKNILGEWVDFKCYLNLEDLEGNPFDRFESVEQSIDKCLNLALVGTGWVASIKDNITKKRTVRATNTSSLDIIKLIKKTYRIEIEYDTLNKVINVYEEIGEDKGAYFIEQLNLESLDVQCNSYDYVTRIIAIGKDGMTIESINNGKDYVENYQYSNKIKTMYWVDERYTVKESLKEDAEAKLKELSMPYRAYSATVINLAKLNSKYKDILDYKIGDTITIVSKSNKVREKQRIIKLREWIDDHSKDTVEIANTTLSFEDIQTEFENAAEIIDNITTDNGTIDGSTIDGIETDQIKDFETNVGKIVNLEAITAEIKNLKADKADIQDLNAVNAKIGTLQATKADITELNAVNATINSLQANKADITELNAISGKITVLESETAKIGVLESNVANIQDLINGNLSSENIQAGAITGDRLNMDTIFVKDANMINVNISALKAGDISTNKFKIKSDDGGIEIVGATQQFKDKNNKVRIQMGKDTQGNFNFILRGEDGTTTLIDHNGIKEKAIADNLIKESMVAPDTIGEKSINYNSFATGFNKDSNTSTIKGTKVRLDNQNQTLEVAFTSLKNQADGTKSLTESHSTTIGVMQGEISTLIADTTITKDGQTVKLKDEYNKTVQTVNSMKNTINSNTTKIDANTGKITGVESKTNVLERDLNSMSSKLTSTENTVSSHTSQISQAQGTANAANSKADNAQSAANNANTKIDNLKIGSVNLFRDTKSYNNPSLWDYREGGVKEEEKFNGLTVMRFDNDWLSWDQFIEAKSDEEFVFSAYVKSGNNTTKLGFFCDNSKDIRNINFSQEEILGTEWKRVSAVFKAASNGVIKPRFEGFLCNNGTCKFYICGCKLERGNKPTNYTEAPEDIQTQIDTNKNDIVTVNTEITTTKNKVSTIEQNMDSITQRVGSVETITTSHTASLNAVDGKINTAKTEAVNSANNHTNNQISIVNQKVSSNTSSIDLLKNKIELKVEQTDLEKNFIDGLENLLVGTRDFNSKYWGRTEFLIDEYYKGLRVQKQTADWQYSYLKSEYVPKLEPNTQYTVSVYLKCKGGSPTVYFTPTTTAANNSARLLTITSNVTEEWKRYSITFNTNNDMYLPNTQIMRVEANNMTGKELFICGIKLEKGSIHKGYNENELDYREYATTKINDAKAEIKLTTDSIKQSVSNVESKTTTINNTLNNTNSEVNTLKSKTTTLENNLSGITGRVTNVESSTASLNGEITSIKSRVQTAEQKLTATSIINSVSEALNSGKSITSASTVLTKDHFKVKSGSHDSYTLAPNNFTMHNSGTGSETLKIINENCYYDGTNSYTYGPVIKPAAGSAHININDANKTNEGNNFMRFNKAGWISVNRGITFNRYIVTEGINRDTNRTTSFGSGNADAGGQGIFSHYTNELNVYVPNAARSWLNYRNWASETRIGNGNGQGGLGKLTCGSLEVTGTKKNIVSTKNFGYIGLQAYETTDCWYGDIGSGITDDNGVCYIHINPVFKETVNTDIDYKVFISIKDEDLQEDDFVMYKINTSNPNFFRVKTNIPNVRFDYEIKARRKGYENVRLERSTYEEEMPKILAPMISDVEADIKENEEELKRNLALMTLDEAGIENNTNMLKINEFIKKERVIQ